MTMDENIGRYIRSRLVNGGDAFNFSGTAPATLLSTDFALSTLFLLEGDQGISGYLSSRDKLLSCKTEKDYFMDRNFDPDLTTGSHSQDYIKNQFTYFTMIALDMAGHSLPDLPFFHEKYGDPDKLEQWIRAQDFSRFWYSSNELMFVRYAAMNNGHSQDAVKRAYNEKGVQQLSKMDHIWTCGLSRLVPEQIIDVLHMAQAKSKGKIGLLIVDYMGILNSEVNKSRYERTTDGIQDLKRMAKDENIVVGACCQVTETGKDDSDGELFLGCTRDSRDIENSSGLVIGAWRTDENTIWTKILKQTQGPSGSKYKWPNNFDGARMIVSPRMQIKPPPPFDMDHKG